MEERDEMRGGGGERRKEVRDSWCFLGILRGGESGGGAGINMTIRTGQPALGRSICLETGNREKKTTTTSTSVLGPSVDSSNP